MLLESKDSELLNCRKRRGTGELLAGCIEWSRVAFFFGVCVYVYVTHVGWAFW